ncbi:MAG TPA: hypothetical protein VG963_19950 [Polyangiaceae bacterium]|nr:hypothetical protein [Polyangiaceae bacterium]
MHDLDRTYREFEDEGGIREAEAFESEGHGACAGQAESEGLFQEAEVQELASNLLSVSNERELDYFLTDLIKKAGSLLGSAVSSAVGKPLGGVLKSVAKAALPLAGSALGNAIVPGLGGMIGGKLAQAGGSLFGLELEGLSQEDREFEAAKQFVRLGLDAAQQALQAVEQGQGTTDAVRRAVIPAAERYAPGLLQPSPGAYAHAPCPHCGGPRTEGRWVRRGRSIVLHGV